jgi:hypothetical protein
VFGEVDAAARFRDNEFFTQDERAIVAIPLEQLNAILGGCAKENFIFF